MPSVYFLSLSLFFAILFSVSKAHAIEDWDPFANMERQQIFADEQAGIPDPFDQDNWPQQSAQWEESKDAYTIKVDIGETKRTDIKIEKGENLLRVSSQPMGEDKPGLSKEIRVPNDADLNLMSYYFAGQYLKFNVPKKRLKSII